MITVEHKGISGIYRIRSLRDERCYIGSAVDLYGRYHRHMHDFRKGHPNTTLARFAAKYSLEALVFEVIETCEKEALIQREQYWMDVSCPFFNLTPRAGSSLGHKMSAETCQKFSAIRKGKPSLSMLGKRRTDATKELIAAKHRGRPLHPNFRAASIRANTGRKQTSDEIRRRSLAQKKVNRQDAREIWWASKLGVFQKDIGRAFNISQRLVCRVLHGVGIYAEYRELDTDYFEAQEKRFADHIAQPSMFAPAQPVFEQGTLLDG